MVYSVPESKRSLAQNQFEYQVPGDDTVYRIIKAKFLTAGQIEKLSDKDNISFVDILDLFSTDEAAGAAVRTLDTEQLQDLMHAWQTDSGIQLGESSASA